MTPSSSRWRFDPYKVAGAQINALVQPPAHLSRIHDYSISFGSCHFERISRCAFPTTLCDSRARPLEIYNTCDVSGSRHLRNQRLRILRRGPSFPPKEINAPYVQIMCRATVFNETANSIWRARYCGGGGGGGGGSGGFTIQFRGHCQNNSCPRFPRIPNCVEILKMKAAILYKLLLLLLLLLLLRRGS